MKIRIGIWPRRRPAASDKPGMPQALDAELLEVLAHDINNLIMIIRGYLDLTRMENRGLSGIAKEGLAIAMKATDNLAAMVSDIVATAQLEDGKLPLAIKNTDMNELIASVIERNKDLAAEAGVKLASAVIGEPIWCDVDKALISRVLENLVANAIRFTPSGGRVSVDADVDKDDLKIAVRDTGFWIPPEYREKIFEKQSQPEAKKANMRRGNGLSLVFCRLAIEAHGGRMRVESAGEDKGCTFIFTMPKDRSGDRGK